MKNLTFVLLNLIATGVFAQSVDQTDFAIANNKIFSRIDFGVRASQDVWTSETPQVKLNGLSFHVKSVIKPNMAGARSMETHEFVAPMGDFQIEVDVYGSNMPNGGKAISLRKLQATLVSFVFSKQLETDPEFGYVADLGYLKLKVLDVIYERHDNHLSSTSFVLAGGELVVHPLQFKDLSKPRPLKIILGVGVDILGVTIGNNLDPRKNEKYLEVFAKNPQTLKGFSSSSRDSVIPRASLKGGISWKNRIHFLSAFNIMRMIPEEVGAEGDRSNVDDTRIDYRRFEHSLRIPLNIKLLGSQLELISTAFYDKFNYLRHTIANPGEENSTAISYELRSNKRVFVGVNFKFSRD